MAYRYFLSCFVFFSFFLGFSSSLAGQVAVVDTAAVEREVDSLIQVSRSFTGKKEFEKALEINLAAEALALKNFGRESAAYGNACFNHGRVLYSKGDFLEAEKWYIEARGIQEKTLGKNHPDYAWTLNNLGVLYEDMVQYEKSEQLLIEVKAIREKILGKAHPDYASSLNNLAVLYKAMGKYEQSEAFYLETISIREKVLGKGHHSYATSLNNLGNLYLAMSNYERAEPLYLESKAIREKVLGKEHPNFASSINSLAALHHSLGNYEKAESLYLECKYIREKILGKEHPNYAMSLQNLGILYYDMGNYEKAEPLYLESKAIIEKVLGKEHPSYASNLHSLAILYWRMTQYKKAELFYLESKSVREKAFGKEHPDYAASLNSLATLYTEMRQYEKAELLYLESKAIRERILGKEHPAYARNLSNLAILYSDIGHYEQAEQLYLEAKSIWEKILSLEHPDYVKNLDNLAILYQEIGSYKRALEFYKEFARLNQLLITKSSNYLSQHELNNYALTFSKNENQFLSFTSTTFAHFSRSTDLAYSNTLFHKGFLLNTANQVRRRALTDSISTEKYYNLKGYRRRLATQYALPIAERDSALVADLEEKANTLEKDLVRTVAGYGEALRQVKWQEVQQQLKKGEAAVEFVSYHYYDKKARATDSTMYAALVLLPTDTAPHFVPLCEARQLDAIINQPNQGANLYYQNIYSIDTAGKAPLYQTLWAPLEPYLKGVDTIYYSPSGLLHRLNLGAIQPARRETLSDRYHLVAMGSTRNLVVPPTVSVAGNTAALFGGIQYEMDSTKIVAANKNLPVDELRLRGSSSFVYTDSTLRGGEKPYLPYTEKEITTINSLLQKNGYQTAVSRNYAATEEALTSIGQGKISPRILHIATHGFFFPDPKENPQSSIRNLQSEEPVFKISDNPMIRSGLLLAGANHAWKTGKPLRPGMEDGILTAYEISQMNLRNTELVVLSACETGLGQIEGNEGVYGLQRAFKIAGAKYLLMSLWQVSDKHTQELMEEFYKNWLDGGKDIPDAFREAQKTMRVKYSNPFYWAGFVLVE